MKEICQPVTEHQVTISPDYQRLFYAASQKERDDALTALLLGLSRAITEYGCHVDISDTNNIRVTKKQTLKDEVHSCQHFLIYHSTNEKQCSECGKIFKLSIMKVG